MGRWKMTRRASRPKEKKDLRNKDTDFWALTGGKE